MPRIPCIELLRRSDVQQKIAQRRLQSVQSKIEEIERNDRDPDGAIRYLKTDG